MRHANDKVYVELLQRLRLGTQTLEDFEKLKSRYLDPNDPDSDFNRKFREIKSTSESDCQIECQGNQSRNAINWIAVLEKARDCIQKTPIVCSAIFGASKRGSMPSTQEITQPLDLGDQNLSRLPPLLPLFEGLPVQITQNISTKLGLANGSTGKVTGYIFPEHTLFKHTSINGVMIKIPSKLPLAVLVDVNEAILPARFPCIPSNVPEKTIPILLFTSTVPITSLCNQNFSVKVSQFPISPLYAATVYKLQGKTCKAVLVYKRNEPGLQKTSLYVLASRVTSFSGLFLYEKLTKEDFEYFRPPKKVLDEENRLNELNKQTLQKYFSGGLFPDAINFTDRNL